VSAQQAENRHRILKLVRKIWIDDYLKHSLDKLARFELGLKENPNAVSRPWDTIVQQPDRAPRQLPAGVSVGWVFDELGQALLILGAPGAGKTTLLLELTRDLLDRAEHGASYPMPVVFHLSSWAVRRRPLADWLVAELTERYYIPRKLAQAWVDAEQVLPLLDGLDEVAPEHREECVEAINTFRRRHGQVPLAVCCRAADYQVLSVRVELSGAVAIEPLSRAQVSTYLKQAGKLLAGVQTALRDDETLWELLDTPLMLSIVALAYRGRSAAEVRATGSLEERRAHLFTAYTKVMFERRTKITEYTQRQTIRWLAWLAQSLMHTNLSIFYVEWMQPNWLSSRAQRWVVAMMPIIFSGLFFGLIGGLVGGLFFRLIGGLRG
jgi:predicted NACHT family NTPase